MGGFLSSGKPPMDMSGLIAKTPGLLDALKSLGLSTGQVVRLSAEWTRQLRQGDERDIPDLLRELNGNGFVSRIDLNALARAAVVDVSTAQRATGLVGGVIGSFSGDPRSLLRKLGRPGRML